MANYDYTRTASQMMQMVLEDIEVLGEGETITAAQSAFILPRLNIVLKRLAAHPQLTLTPYRRRRITLFLQEGQHEYLIPGSSVFASPQHGRTTLDAAEAAAQTVISVTATSDTTTNPGTTFQMKPGDSAGVQQDDGTIFWSIITARATNDTMTLATGLDSAAASGKYVWWFTEPAARFLDVESALLRNINLTDAPLPVYRIPASYDQGNSNKYADGRPTSIWFEPLAAQSRILLDTQPTEVTDTLVLTVLYPFQDYDAATEELVMPPEALALVEWELALSISPAYGKSWTQEMKDNRQLAWDAARSLNFETSDLYYQRDA